MPDDEFAALVEDIRENGLREPVTVFEHKVLDGWHRFRACEKAGVVCKTIQLPVTKDPVAYVLSRNAHRRHLTASQRAAAVALCAEWRPRGGDQSAPGALRSTDAELAKTAGVSERTIEQAKAGIRAGLGDQLRNGDLSAKKAAEIAADKPAKPKKPSPLETENAQLKERIEELSENLPELTAMASAAEAVKNDEHFKKILHLEQENAQLKRSRDDFMRECAQLKKQNAHLQRRLKKYEK